MGNLSKPVWTELSQGHLRPEVLTQEAEVLVLERLWCISISLRISTAQSKGDSTALNIHHQRSHMMHLLFKRHATSQSSSLCRKLLKMKECKYVTTSVHLFSHLSSFVPMMTMILKAYMKTVQFLGFLVYTSHLGSVWQNPKWMGLTLETNEKYPLALPQYCIMIPWLFYVCSLQWNHWKASRCCAKFPCTKSLQGVL